MNAGIQGKQGILIDANETMNEAVREVISEIDIRSTKRRSALQPKLFSNVYDYALPSDLKGLKIIDIPPQVKRADEFFLIPPEEFDRLKGRSDGAIAIDEYNGTKVLKITVNIDDKTLLVSSLDSLTSGGGTWVLFGDGTNLTADTDNYVVGGGSINWDISAAGGTTAGIQNSGLTPFDLDNDYLGGNGAAFVWAYLNSSTNVTNFILLLGSDSSTFHSKTITTRHDGTAFVDGWNLLRFDLTSLSDTGTPDDDAIDYAAIYMTKDAAKVSETDYRFDHLILRKGEIHEVQYYSKYGWTSSAGAYKENSTDDSDLLVADTDEYKLFVKKAQIIAAQEIRDPELVRDYVAEYTNLKRAYELANPSEAKVITNEYYNYAA